MLPKAEKDEAMIEKARSLQGICWGNEYERMIGGMLYVVSPGSFLQWAMH